MEIKRLLKYFAKNQYPGPEVLKTMIYMSYNSENFLGDLVDEIGKEETMDFVNKTFNKLSSGIHSEISIKIPLRYTAEKGSWIYLIINHFNIVLNEEPSDVLINHSWGDSKIINPDGFETTIEDISSEVDMGGMNEYHDFIDSIRNECYTFIRENCGFGILFE